MGKLSVDVTLSRVKKPNSYLCYNTYQGRHYKKVTIHEEPAISVMEAFAIDRKIIPNQKDMGT
tara:strand:+ start:574 stop:762 length:189 start_codon:yes stop_codon:yes gene_type:complete